MELVKSIKAIEQEDICGFHLASMLDPASPDYADSSLVPFTLSGEPYQLLCGILRSTLLDDNVVRPHAEAFSLNRIAKHGVSYGTYASPSFRDSSIVFRGSSSVPPHAHDLHKAGRIEKIFQHVYQGIKTFYLVVREHQRIDPIIDPYVRFGFAGGYLCEKVPRLLHLIKLEQVVSHFALMIMCSNGQKHLIHALPIDRVCPISYLLSPLLTVCSSCCPSNYLKIFTPATAMMNKLLLWISTSFTFGQLEHMSTYTFPFTPSHKWRYLLEQ